MKDAEAVRRLARVRVDTLIWLIFAIVLFLISAWMTHLITKVDRQPPQRGIELTFESQGKPVRLPIVTFTAKDKALDIAITSIAQNVETVRLGPFPQGVEAELSCTTRNRMFTSAWSPASDDELGMIAKNPKKTPLEYVLRLGDLRYPLGTATTTVSRNVALKIFQHLRAADIALNDRFVARIKTQSYLQDSLTCSLPVDIAKDTYTSRSFDVAVTDGVPLVQTSAQPKDRDDTGNLPSQVSLHDDDAQEIHVTNRETGVTYLASSISGPYVDEKDRNYINSATLHFAWESLGATSHRDIYITVIGTLIALGAAALIEACRPYIEALVRVRPER